MLCKIKISVELVKKIIEICKGVLCKTPYFELKKWILNLTYNVESYNRCCGIIMQLNAWNYSL